MHIQRNNTPDFPNLVKGKNLRIQEAQQTPSRIIFFKVLKYTIVELLKTKNKEKSHKSSQRKLQLHIVGQQFQNLLISHQKLWR